MQKQNNSSAMSGAGKACRRKPLTIIGLGNELLSDDGVGIRVVRALKERLHREDAVIEELSVGGLQLLDYIAGYDQCVIVDAMVTGDHPAGTMVRFIQSAAIEPVRPTSSHQIDLGQIVTLGGMLGIDLPTTLIVYGIEAGDVTTFQDGCTEAVAGALPALVEQIRRDLEEVQSEDPARQEITSSV
jgi:hydrogenase maturation protease